jgi:AAA15 family ATPase/GTPase
MKVTKVRIENTMNFKGPTEIELSRFNVFIGKNGTGKSNMLKIINRLPSTGINQSVPFAPFDNNFTLPQSIYGLMTLEDDDIRRISESRQFASLPNNTADGALKMNFLKHKKLNLSRSWKRASGQLSSTYKIDELDGIVNWNNRFQSTFDDIVFKEIQSQCLFLPDTRDLSYNFRLSDSPYGGASEFDTLNPSNIMKYVTRWKLNNREIYDSFVNECRKIIGEFDDANIEFGEPGSAVMSMASRGLTSPIPGSEISKGTREIMVIIGTLILAPPSSSIFIEEPEVHLFKSAIRTLKDIMIQKLKEKNLQITLTTHSKIFLEGLDPHTDKSVRIFAFEKDPNDGSCSVREQKEDAEIAKFYDL